jgi:hypothetical protein
VVTDTPENKQKIIESTRKLHPDVIRRTFNEILGCLCKKHGYDFISIDNALTLSPSTDLKASVVKKEYTDIFELSTHLNWETNIKFYQSEFNTINFKIHSTFNLIHSRSQYLEEKRQRLKRLPRFTVHNETDSDPSSNTRNIPSEKDRPVKRIKFV